ncbi:Activator of stress proteins 1 [Elsinoe australis]|uniref:Activator of stress proteins 1 n=1 Tax=Elsinoe australis TaxID=40998 RepID=A0A2P7YMV9_9PEZI|nr:Activator of stress proteins 1 [Elsinoe australis]
MTPWKAQLPDRSKAPGNMQNTNNDASDESNGNTKASIRDDSDGSENVSSLGLDGSNDGRGRRTRNMGQPPAPPVHPPAVPAPNPPIRGSGVGDRGSGQGSGYPPRLRWYRSPLHEEIGRYMRREVGRDALPESVGAVAERLGGVGVAADVGEKREGGDGKREENDGQEQGQGELPSVAMGVVFEEVGGLWGLEGLFEVGKGEEEIEGGAESE